MKRKILITIGFICAALFITLFLLSKRVMYRNINADRIRFAHSYEELKEKSDLIVIAEVSSDKENTLFTDPSDGIVYYGLTYTGLVVKEVIKGDCGGTIKITEDYYTIKSPLGTEIFTQGCYLPAKTGEEYVFFLIKYEETSEYAGMYCPLDLQNGRYVTKKVGKAAKDLELRECSDLDFVLDEYFDLYQKVYDEYIE